MTDRAFDQRFADVYNDPESFPSLGHVAQEMNVSVKTVQNRAGEMRRLREKGLGDVPELISRKGTPRLLPSSAADVEAAKLGHAPGHFDTGVAPGFAMGKITIQRDREGAIERTWERQHPDHEQMLKAMEHITAGMMSAIPAAAPIASPTSTIADLMALYTFTDYHLGMLAWHREGGDDYDLVIAESLAMRAMNAMVAGSPDAGSAIINIQGDFLHYDSLTAVTPTSGHVVDTDSRYGKIVEVAIRLIRALVRAALTKHGHVTLLICEGNHDIGGSLWLRKLFKTFYEDEPRITVHDSDLPYYAIEFGNTMLGFHHGHLKNNASLPALFAAQFREMWGRCRKVVIHTGHRHHREIKEHPGAEVHQHPTLAARDAHAARGGYWSERRIETLIYHRDHGEVGSHTITPEMLN